VVVLWAIETRIPSVMYTGLVSFSRFSFFVVALIDRLTALLHISTKRLLVPIPREVICTVQYKCLATGGQRHRAETIFHGY